MLNRLYQLNKDDDVGQDGDDGDDDVDYNLNDDNDDDDVCLRLILVIPPLTYSSFLLKNFIPLETLFGKPENSHLFFKLKNLNIMAKCP